MVKKLRNYWIISVLLVVFSMSILSAVAIGDQLHLNIQTTNPSTGEIVTGTFNFAFNITTDSACSTVVYSNLTSLTTDSRGIVSYYLENINLDFTEQYYLCYYRDGVLINNSKIARSPYSFTSKNTTISGLIIDDNLDMGSYNVTASYLGVGLTTPKNVLNVQGDVNFTGGNFMVNENVFFVDVSTIRIGIGTSTPQNTLNVIGDLNVTANISTPMLCLDGDCQTTWGAAVTGEGGWNDTGTLVELVTSSDNVSANTLFVDNSAGRVGIGITSPGVALDVSGIISSSSDILADNSVQATNYMRTPVITPISSNTGINFTDYGQTISLMYVNDTNGNVGIGTTSPAEALHVVGNGIMSTGLSVGSTNRAGYVFRVLGSSKLDGNVLLDGNTGNGYFQINDLANRRANIEFQSAGVAKWSVGRGDSDELSDDTFFIGTGTTGGTNAKLVINSTGNVGIGTTNPARRLEVRTDAGTTTYANNYLRLTTATAGSYLQDNVIEFAYNDYGNYNLINMLGKIVSVKVGGASSADVAGDLSFYTKAKGGTAATAPLERMRILNDGNIGIGTTSPSQRLEVNGKMVINGSNSGTSPDYPMFFLGSIANPVGRDMMDVRIDSDGGNTQIFSLTDGGEGYFAGNVGIGTTTPSQKLDVNGSAIISGGLDMNGNSITNVANGTATNDAVNLGQLNALNGNVSGNFVPYTGANQNVDLGNNNLTTTGTSFFEFLGNLTSRINKIFVQNIDANGSVDISNDLYVGGNVEVNGDVKVDGFVYSDVCPSDMAYIDKVGGYCIDKYEASMPGATSSVMGTSGEIANRNNPGTMKAESKSGVIPWVRVSQVSARTACTNAGKNLCSDAEWLGAANLQGQMYYLPMSLNVAPYYCVVSSSTYCSGNSYEGGAACDTGTYSGGASGCYSSEGVYDMTGNVWEWTDEVVDVVNPDGVAGWKYANAEGEWQSSTSGLWNKYGNDGVYFPTTITTRAVLRGGYWYNGATAGPFSARLNIAPTTTRSFIGFRCCSASS